MIKLVTDRLTNWTIVPAPTMAWAQVVHPDLSPEAALERLWEEVVFICRLDHPDPAQAWLERMYRLREITAMLDERRFSAIAFKGDGTDLTVGLLPELAMARRVVLAVRRPRALPEHPQRGGVHRTRPTAG